MSLTRDVDGTKFYTMPQAKIFFQHEGQEEVEDLGNATDVSVEITVEREEFFSHTGEMRHLDMAVPREVQGQINLTLLHFTDFNRAAAIGAKAQYQNRSSSAGETKSITGVKKTTYKLAHTRVSNVVVTDGAGTVTYVPGTDVIVDQKAGFVQVLNIPDTADTDLEITYDVDEITEGYRAQAGANPQLRGTFYIRGTNRQGAVGLMTIPMLEIGPSQARSFVAEGKGEIGLSGRIIYDDSQAEGDEMGWEEAL